MIVFGKESCEFCDKAKELLEEVTIPYIYVDIGRNSALKQDLMDYLDSINAPHTVPQVFGDEGHIGGYDKLAWYLQHKGYLEEIV